MKKLSKRQEEILQEAHKYANELLKACEQAESGNITFEEFEKRVSKTTRHGHILIPDHHH